MMVEGLRHQGHQTFVSESHFYLMWEKEHKSVVIPKVRMANSQRQLLGIPVYYNIIVIT